MRPADRTTKRVALVAALTGLLGAGLTFGAARCAGAQGARAADTGQRTAPANPPGPGPGPGVAPPQQGGLGPVQVKLLMEVDYARGTDPRAQLPPYPSEGFGVRRMRVFLQGTGPLGLGYRLHFDPTQLASGPQGASPFRGVPLVEAYIDYAFPRDVLVRVGQQRVLFGLNSTTGAPSLPTPEFAQFARSVQQRVSAFRDVGATVQGRLGAVEYSSGVFNGAGLNVLADNDSTRDFVGRVTYALVPGLQIGASGWTGHAPRQYTRPGETRPVAPFLDNADFRRYGADLRYARGPLLLTAEYARNKAAFDSAAVTRPPGGVALRQTGYNALAAVRLGALSPALRRLEAVGRYDVWDPNGAVADDEVTELVGGLNFYFAEIGAPPDKRLGRALNYVQRESRFMLFLEHSRFANAGTRPAPTPAAPNPAPVQNNTRVHARWSLFY